jgi:hypothetical protein
MDYYVSSIESLVRIKKENFDKVTDILSDYTGRHKGDYFRPEDWMDESTVKLSTAFLKLGWLPEFDITGDMQELSFVDDQLLDEDRWFQDIAPFVESGSYIDMLGEDVTHWRIYFDGQVVETYPGFVTYPDCPETLQIILKHPTMAHADCDGNCECCGSHHGYEPGTTDYEETEDMIVPLF